MILDLLAESIRRAREPAHAHPHRPTPPASSAERGSGSPDGRIHRIRPTPASAARDSLVIMDEPSRGRPVVRCERKRPTSGSRDADYAVRVHHTAQSRTRREGRSMSTVRFVVLDVHAETIAIALAEPGGEVRSLGVIPNRAEAVRKMVGKLGPATTLRICYEAGPTGYALYWQLTALGVHCDVVAPTLVPIKAGDRVKTDRRDALKLARSYRAGDLTTVWVPDAAHEALRDLVRAREVAKRDQLRARQRLGKFLLRHGRQRPATLKTAWTRGHVEWIKTAVHFDQPAQDIVLADYVAEVEHVAARIGRLDLAIADAARTAPPRMKAVIAALQALRGVAEITAVTIVAEVGDLSRFQRAPP